MSSKKHNKDYDDYEEKPNRTKHPKHLKGRDIGLFYAKKSRERRKELRKEAREEQHMQLGPDVSLSKSKIEEIRSMSGLNKTKSTEPKVKEGLFSNIVDSTFKDDYYRIKTADLEKMILHQIAEDSKTEEEAGAIANDETEKNKTLLEEFQLKKSKSGYRDMLAFREKLPALKKQKEILEAIDKNQIILIKGHTGCGKTTQVPQFILDDFIESGKSTQCHIICTQPRRISAISIAERVANERNENLCNSVGYQIRLESRMPKPNAGNMLFCTTGIVLKFLETNPTLKGISHLIIDEIHERDVLSDLLLAVLKLIIKYRTDLKIILMSATLQANTFSKYFFNCPMIEIEGLTYPVEELYLEDVLELLKFNNTQSLRKIRPGDRYRDERNSDAEYQSFIDPFIRSLKGKYSSRVLDLITNYNFDEINYELLEELIFHISTNKPDGAILVFLTGMDTISKLHRLLTNSNRFPSHKYRIYPLHSSLPSMQQKSIFERPPKGIRKIVIATNIAETSITIDDVVYVINSGKMKYKTYNVENNIQQLQEEWISLENETQRKGRCGRVQEGTCYHLYIKARHYALETSILPEILRTRLEDVILSLKVLCLGNIRKFLKNVISVPNENTINNSINFLKRLTALDEEEHLTPLGLHLARLPMDAQSGKMILLGAIFSCIDPITSIAASLTFKNAFVMPIGKERIVEAKKLDFSGRTRSDHLMLAIVMAEWRKFKKENNNSDHKFCRENFLSSGTLRQLENMKSQFCDLLFHSKFLASANSEYADSNVNSKKEKLLKAIICGGLYPNIGYIKKIKTIKNRADANLTIFTKEDGKVCIHPSSVNCRQQSFDSRFIVYHMKQKSRSVNLFDTTMVNPYPILFFGDMITVEHSQGKCFITVADSYRFKCDANTVKLILDLRDGLNSLLQKKICDPSPINWNGEEGNLLKAIIYLITIDGDDFFSDEEFDIDDI